MDKEKVLITLWCVINCALTSCKYIKDLSQFLHELPVNLDSGI